MIEYKNYFYEKYKKDVFSQHGEDGIIEAILNKLNLTDRWCCEFGAWDGMHLSNTFNLIKNRDFNAVLIEGDSSKFNQLLTLSQRYNKITPVNKFVDLEENSLDNILSSTSIPTEFSLLSIDIDSYDYQVWESLQKYKPVVVVIEIHSGIFPLNEEWIHDDAKRINSTSFLPTLKLGKEKGYSYVCHSGNMFFVRNDYFHLLGIQEEENPVCNFRRDWMRDYYKDQYEIFCNYYSDK